MLKVIAKNAGSNVLVMVVKIGFSFIMAPVIVHALGNYDYGLWEIVFSLVGYMGLMDIGMRPAVTRYVAKFRAENDREKLEQVFTSAVIFNAVVGSFGCAILLFWAVFKPELLAENPVADYQRYLFFLVIIGVQVFFQFPGYVAECFHEGYQRHYLKNTITLINTFVGNTILYYLLTHGFGLLTLALGNCIGISLKYIIYFILLGQKEYGGYSFRAKNFSVSMLRTLVGFGAKTFVQSTASTIAGSIGPLVIGFFLGPALVPFFTIPNRLVSYVRELSMTVTNVFLPVFSHLHAVDNRDKLVRTYLSSTKFISGMIIPALVGVSLLGPSFITCWIGPEYGDSSSIVLLFLAGSAIIYMLNPLHQRYLTGIGKIDFLARVRVLTTVSLFLISLFLVKPFGKNGVAGAFFIVSLVFEPVIFVYTCRQLGVSPLNFLGRVHLRTIVPNLILAVAVYCVVGKYRLSTYADIILIAVPAGTTYLFLFWFISITSNERLFLVGKLKSFFS